MQKHRSFFYRRGRGEISGGNGAESLCVLRVTLRSLCGPLFFFFLLHLPTVAQEKTEKRFELACIGFYNVENLYDTEDDPLTNDAEFLPGGANQWTEERYRAKLQNLVRVLSQLGTDSSPEGALAIGLSEIENRRVLEDLVQTPGLKEKKYGIVHYDGPDRRGVDVALIYRIDYFKVESSRSIRVSNPSDTSFRTRDQLLVSGFLNGERIHLMVAHWPSRRGGEKASAPLRMLAAQAGRSVIDSILAAEPGAKIIYMGDLNDDPVNKSLTEGLRAKGKAGKLKEGELFNTMAAYYQDGIGTLAYRDVWNLFDQLIVSPGLLNREQPGFHYRKSKIFNKPFVRKEEGNFAGYPFRTFVGGNYEGGYSDHFAVYLVLAREVH